MLFFLMLLSAVYLLLLTSLPLIWSSHSMEEIIMLNSFKQAFQPFSNWFGHLYLIKFIYLPLEQYSQNPGLDSFLIRQVIYFFSCSFSLLLLLKVARIGTSLSYLFCFLFLLHPSIQHILLAAENNFSLFGLQFLFLTYFYQLSEQSDPRGNFSLPAIGLLGILLAFMILFHSLAKFYLFLILFFPLDLMFRKRELLRIKFLLTLIATSILFSFQFFSDYALGLSSVFENNFIVPVAELPAIYTLNFWKNYVFIGIHKSLWAGFGDSQLWSRILLKVFSMATVVAILFKIFKVCKSTLKKDSCLFSQILLQLIILSGAIGVFYRPPQLEYWSPFFLFFLLLLFLDFRTSRLSKRLIILFSLVGLISLPSRLQSFIAGEIPLTNTEAEQFLGLYKKIKSVENPEIFRTVLASYEYAPYDGLIKIHFPIAAAEIYYQDQAGAIFHSPPCLNSKKWCSVVPPFTIGRGIANKWLNPLEERPLFMPLILRLP